MRLPGKLDERGVARELRRHINELSDAIRSLQISNGVGYRKKHTAIGTVLQIGDRRTTIRGDIVISRFQVKDVFSNYLVCQRLSVDNNSVTGDLVNVLRPYATLLNDSSSLPLGILETISISTSDTTRNLSRTLTWTHQSETFTLDQHIFPTYDPQDQAGLGSRIYAASNVDGGTGIDGNGDTLQWIDLNVDARHWALVELQYVEVCVSGETKHMYVPASAVGVTP